MDNQIIHRKIITFMTGEFNPWQKKTREIISYHKTHIQIFCSSRGLLAFRKLGYETEATTPKEDNLPRKFPFVTHKNQFLKKNLIKKKTNYLKCIIAVYI